MPRLDRMRTVADLLGAIRFLTQLEGMGVISALRKRTNEKGLLDRDYQVLMNASDRRKRVAEYFRILKNLEASRNAQLKSKHFGILDRMSGRETRLWYIAGCYMAQQIESKYGIETLKQLVVIGANEFFTLYEEVDKRAVGHVHAN